MTSLLNAALDSACVPFSPLVLADCLLTLAKEADLAGYRESASRLLSAAYAAFDDEKASADAA